MSISPYISNLGSGQKAFVFYRLPNGGEINLLVHGEETTVLKEGWQGKNGFLFAPFSAKDASHLLEAKARTNKPDEIEPVLSALDGLPENADGEPMVSTEESYFRQFELFQNAFAKGNCQKAILSRILKEKKPSGFHLGKAYMELAKSYPTAFVYLIYTPETGCWMGATPEVLLTTQNGIGHTMALAGTQAKRDLDSAIWGAKEKEEQAFVSRFIREELQQSGIKEITEVGPNTVEAGSILHLQSIFSFPVQKDNGASVAKLLHPTPAVCGTPPHKALNLIQEVELHERAYYAGYLGPVADGHCQLFVNLRCMQIGNEGLFLHVGGGLTAASEKEKEWEETQLKAKTLLAVIQNL